MENNKLPTIQWVKNVPGARQLRINIFWFTVTIAFLNWRRVNKDGK